MEKDISLSAYLKVIKKKRKMIIAITLSIVLITLIVSLIMPKTYESIAVIELGSYAVIELSEEGTKIEEELIMSTVEAKNIIESSIMLDPIINKYFRESDEMTIEKFNEDNLEIEIIEEQIGLRTTEATNFLRITVKADKAIKSKEMISDLIGNFLDYADIRFYKNKILVTEKYNESKKNIERDIKKTKENIYKLRTEISEREEEIDSLSTKKEEWLSRITLLKTIMSEKRELLLQEQNELARLRQGLVDLKFDFGREMSYTKKFRMITEPELPLKYSKPNIKLNLLMALIVGLFFSVLFAFFQEGWKKR